MSKEPKEVIKELDTPTTPPSKKKWSWRDPNISLAAFLGISLLAAGIVVGIGHLLYVTSSEYKLDITRPGLKDIKKDELVEVDRSKAYDSTSDVDGAALTAEQKSMSSRLQDLDRYGDFADDDITSQQEAVINDGSNNSNPSQ